MSVKSRSIRQSRRNDLVPGALRGIGICEGVLGKRCSIDSYRKTWPSGVPGAVEDNCRNGSYAGKCDPELFKVFVQGEVYKRVI